MNQQLAVNSAPTLCCFALDTNGLRESNAHWCTAFDQCAAVVLQYCRLNLVAFPLALPLCDSRRKPCAIYVTLLGGNFVFCCNLRVTLNNNNNNNYDRNQSTKILSYQFWPIKNCIVSFIINFSDRQFKSFSQLSIGIVLSHQGC